MIGYQELLPHMERDTKVANTVRQNGEATLATFTGPLFSENRTESRQQGMVRGVENDARVANTVRQNGETARKAQEQSLSAVRREQETQIRTLHIDDDGDEDNVAAAENGQVRTEHQASGARVFALNRPHAWHQELSKKRHEAAVDDPVIDRQVPSWLHVAGVFSTNSVRPQGTSFESLNPHLPPRLHVGFAQKRREIFSPELSWRMAIISGEERWGVRCLWIGWEEDYLNYLLFVGTLNSNFSSIAESTVLYIACMGGEFLCSAIRFLQNVDIFWEFIVMQNCSFKNA